MVLTGAGWSWLKAGAGMAPPEAGLEVGWKLELAGAGWKLAWSWLGASLALEQAWSWSRLGARWNLELAGSEQEAGAGWKLVMVEAGLELAD